MFTSQCCSGLSPSAHEAPFLLFSSSSLPCPVPGRRVLTLQYPRAVFVINTAETCGNFKRSSQTKYIKNKVTENKELSHCSRYTCFRHQFSSSMAVRSLSTFLTPQTASSLAKMSSWYSICNSSVPFWRVEADQTRVQPQNYFNKLVVKSAFGHLW